MIDWRGDRRLVRRGDSIPPGSTPEAPEEPKPKPKAKTRKVTKRKATKP